MSGSSAETHEFQAEVNAVLRLVTNSLYTNNEIFLRELVSNASDALDKARFQALVQDDLRGKELESEIVITADQQAGTLVIEDNGIGMTQDEARRNLGTIAHSGTLKYLEQMEKEGRKADASLIGHFGVGFYSAFMVAKEVHVETLSAHPEGEPVRWSSLGDGRFEISKGSREGRGSRIELLLKDDAKEFLEQFRIQSIVRRYSNYVMHPIHLVVVDAQGKRSEPEKINAASAFWARTPKEVSDDDYKEFYTHVMGGFVMPGDEPLARLHFSMDAPIQFNALVFVPRHAPADLFLEDRKALLLYAKRVMVMDSCDKLLPQYLRFFRGVVDSQDLPLNVSREMLQEHQSLAAIRRQLTRKALKLLADEAESDADSYAKLWAEFGAVIKEGLHSDSGHREELLKIARWKSIGHGDDLLSLADYAKAMPEGQDFVYFIAGQSEAALRASPHVEAVRARGQDVLLMTDAVDEWVLQTLRDFEGKEFRSVTQGELAQAEGEETVPSPIDPLLAKAREILGERVTDVRASKRLKESASCLVDQTGGMSRNMERILRQAQKDVSTGSQVLELNPDHVFVKKTCALVVDKPDDPHISTWIELLLDLASLAEGQVPDPAGTVKRVQSVLDELG